MSPPSTFCQFIVFRHCLPPSVDASYYLSLPFTARLRLLTSGPGCRCQSQSVAVCDSMFLSLSVSDAICYSPPLSITVRHLAAGVSACRFLEMSVAEWNCPPPLVTARRRLSASFTLCHRPSPYFVAYNSPLLPLSQSPSVTACRRRRQCRCLWPPVAACYRI